MVKRNNYALMVLKDGTYRWYRKTVRMECTKRRYAWMVQKRRFETLVPKPQNKQTKQRDKRKTGKKEWYKMTVRKELVSWCFEPSQPHKVVAYQTKHILVVQKDCTERYSQYRKTVRKGGAKR